MTTITDPHFRPKVLPLGNYAVVDIHDNIVRTFNNMDDAATYAAERNDLWDHWINDDYRIWSAVDKKWNTANVIRALTQDRARAIAVMAGFSPKDTVITDLSEYYRSPDGTVLSYLKDKEGFLEVMAYFDDNRKIHYRFFIWAM